MRFLSFATAVTSPQNIKRGFFALLKLSFRRAKKPLCIAIKPLLHYDCTPFALQNDPFCAAKGVVLPWNVVLLAFRRLHIRDTNHRIRLYISNIRAARAKLKNFELKTSLLVQLAVLSSQKCKYRTWSGASVVVEKKHKEVDSRHKQSGLKAQQAHRRVYQKPIIRAESPISS